MSNETWKLEKDLCRCCHSEGSFKNLSETSDEGQEVYSDMLQFALDINVLPVAGMLCCVTYTICEQCSDRLRDAVSFKRQVLQCEERFRDMYDKDGIKVLTTGDLKVKEEVPEEYPEVDGKPDLPTMDGDDSDDFPLNDLNSEEIKQEDPKKSKPKKAKQKKKLGRPKKTDAGNGEKKGGKTPTKSIFRLQEADYTRDGEQYVCGRCDKRYDKIFSLRFHVKTKHYKIPRFSCPYCMETFFTPAPLTVHKLQEHNIDDRFNCNACKGTFNTKIQLRKHINNFHMLGEKYKCEFCEYESFSFEGLYKHKFKHKTVKDYHCRFCRKSFLRKTTLDLHERIHTGDRRKICKVCGQAFVQKASLNYHMTKYHPEVNF
ncbi:zinc finger protein 39-like isoform X3 [Galleria mellonella]|uniref:Zinc finger protein 39-like isoform X3 n=1 Tax=Galleria mellonella TaxID=7137 RepID=A0ABM3N0R1_GALME|nr:zinc finger protein 39-like isoform X3 [Galleria mellonella]